MFAFFTDPAKMVHWLAGSGADPGPDPVGGGGGVARSQRCGAPEATHGCAFRNGIGSHTTETGPHDTDGGGGDDMGKSVVHWEINAKDAAKLQTFYARLFDWTVDANNPMKYGLVKTGGKGGIDGGIGPAQGPTGVTFYVQVDNLDSYLRKAESLGGKTVIKPTEIPNMVTFALFTDPEGNRIGLVKG